MAVKIEIDSLRHYELVQQRQVNQESRKILEEILEKQKEIEKKVSGEDDKKNKSSKRRRKG